MWVSKFRKHFDLIYGYSFNICVVYPVHPNLLIILLTFIHILREPVQDPSCWRGLEKRHRAPHDAVNHAIMQSGWAFQKINGQKHAFYDAYNNNAYNSHSICQLVEPKVRIISDKAF